MTKKYNISLSLVAPAYNEEESVGVAVKKFIRDLSALVHDFEIILVDDGSRDRTWEIVLEMAKSYKQIRPIKHEFNRGIGTATRTGVCAATKDYIFWDPVDMSFDTKDLPLLLDKLTEADIVIGYRPNRTANNLYRKITSYVNYWLIRILSRLPIKDFQHVQIYPKRLFEQITINSTSTFLPPEVIIKAIRANYSYSQVEIGGQPRRLGTSKCKSMKVIFKSVIEIFSFFLFEKKKDKTIAISYVD